MGTAKDPGTKRAVRDVVIGLDRLRRDGWAVQAAIDLVVREGTSRGHLFYVDSKECLRCRECGYNECGCHDTRRSK